MQTVSIQVTGKVQGVFFRKHACEAATRFGLGGYVRNLADGSVSLVATGTPEAIEQLVAWCHQGSPGARVASVLVSQVELQQFNRFTIRHS